MNGVLSPAGVKRFAASSASHDDGDALINFASKSIELSELEKGALAVHSGFYEGGMSSFASRISLVLPSRELALSFTAEIASVLKRSVIECRDAAAWTFLLEAARLEALEKSFAYLDAREAVAELRSTLGDAALEEMLFGTVTSAAFLLSELKDPSRERWRRPMWQVKQYAEDPSVAAYLSHVTESEKPGKQFAAMRNMILFGPPVTNVVDYPDTIRRLLPKVVPNCFEETSASVVANMLGVCAIRLRSIDALRDIRELEGISRERSAMLSAWCATKIEEKMRWNARPDA
jgi:hypothetical protein